MALERDRIDWRAAGAGRHIAVSLVGLWLAFALPAHAEPTKCQRTVLKAAAGFAQGRIKVLTKCEDARLKGKILTSCDLDDNQGDSIDPPSLVECTPIGP